MCKKRNAMRVGLMCVGYNMKHGLSLLRESVTFHPLQADEMPVKRAFLAVKRGLLLGF
jgi:hypothetical protein